MQIVERIKTEIVDRFLETGLYKIPTNTVDCSINLFRLTESNSSKVCINTKNKMEQIMTIYNRAIIDRIISIHNQLAHNPFIIYWDENTVTTHEVKFYMYIILCDINDQVYIDVEIRIDIYLDYKYRCKDIIIAHLSNIVIQYNLEEYFGNLQTHVYNNARYTYPDMFSYKSVDLYDELKVISNLYILDNIQMQQRIDIMLKNYDRYNSKIVQYIPINSKCVFEFVIIDTEYIIEIDYYNSTINLMINGNYKGYPLQYFKEVIQNLSEFIKLKHDVDPSEFISSSCSGSYTKSATFK